MARVRIDHPRTLMVRILEAYSRRKYGRVLQPGLVAYNNRRVLRTYLRAELSTAKWNTVDQQLKQLAVMAAAAELGCSWCMDFGYWETTRTGVDPAKMRDVPRWRDSDVYTDLERRVLAYAEAVSSTPLAVTDEMVEGLRRDLDDAALVELTMTIAVENSRSRFNSALGLTSQGFTDRCEIPARIAAARTAAP
jgi:alkylhydroperoxidase family enzyme